MTWTIAAFVWAIAAASVGLLTYEIRGAAREITEALDRLTKAIRERKDPDNLY